MLTETVRNEREVCADHEGPKDGPCRRCGHPHAKHPQWAEQLTVEVQAGAD